jgi:hypothetical protein
LAAAASRPAAAAPARPARVALAAPCAALPVDQIQDAIIAPRALQFGRIRVLGATQGLPSRDSPSSTSRSPPDVISRFSFGDFVPTRNSLPTRTSKNLPALKLRRIPTHRVARRSIAARYWPSSQRGIPGSRAQRAPGKARRPSRACCPSEPLIRPASPLECV